MALLTNKKFIHFNSKSDFNTYLTNNSIADYQIVFIKDAGLIWTHGKYYGQSEVYIGATEPTDSNIKIWIDTSVSNETVEVYTKSQANTTFLPISSLSSTTRSTKEIGVDEKYYAVEYDKNGHLAVDVPIEGSASITETLLVSLSANMGNASALNGAVITVSIAGSTLTETWNGSQVSFTLPFNESYTVSVSSVSGYKTPASQAYTSVIGFTRPITFQYSAAQLTIQRDSNQSYDLGNSSATISYGTSSQVVNFTNEVESQTILLPAETAATIVFSNISSYATPSDISITSAEMTGNLNKTGTYTASKLEWGLTSNQSSNVNYASEINGASVTLSYNNTTLTQGDYVLVPFGTTGIDVTYNALSGYTAPAATTVNADQTTVSITGQYNATILSLVANVDAAGGYNSNDVTFTINGVDATTSEVKIPTGTTVNVTTTTLSGYGCTLSPASGFTATGASQTLTATYSYGSVFTAYINSNQDSVGRTDAATNLGSETITVAYTGFSAELEHGDTTIIPPGSSVTLTFSNVNTDYKKPDTITISSTVAGTNYDTSSSVYQTEVLSVTATTDNASVIGQNITVNSVTKSWQGTTLTWKIPYGSSDVITADAKSGYKCTITTLGTADSVTKSGTVAYTELVSGIFVMKADGTEVAVSQGNSSCVGVVVRDASKNIAFFMAKTSKNSIAWSGSHSSLNITGITENNNGYTSSSPGITDTFRTWTTTNYNNGETGVSNTDNIVAQCTSDTTSNNAAKYCRSIVNPVTGTYDGYLGSPAEWVVVFDNLSAINSALGTIGGTQLTSTDSGYSSGSDTYTRYWTSGEYSASVAWYLVFYSRYSYPCFYDYGKSYSAQSFCARVFFPL